MQDTTHSVLKDHEQQGLFVTGTDTGVGKTFVAAALVAKLRASYWKPIQTGPEQDHDTPEIQRLTGLRDQSIYPCSYSFPDPLSPHAAAARVDQTIKLDNILFPKIQKNEYLVVEGAGGVMVPLNDNDMMSDLMVRLNLPVVIVARSGLGTINHTLLTIEALRSRGLDLVGVIMNGIENPGNRQAIEQYGRVQVLAELPHCEEVNKNTITALMPRLDKVAEILGRNNSHD